jgi:hypothetical protein
MGNLDLKADVAAMTIGYFERSKTVVLLMFLMRNKSKNAMSEYCAYRRASKGTSPASNNDLVAMLIQYETRSRRTGGEYSSPLENLMSKHCCSYM